jgi:UDP-N-acetylmuramoylalanine--D-glutamate ligase
VLSRIARPDIGLITNIGYAHVGLFGSLAATTRAKFEIADGLAADGFLLLNGDDPRLAAEARRRGIKTIYFGCSPRCSLRPTQVAFDAARGLSFVLDGQAFRLAVPGRHFLYSALPAVFLGRRCGVPDDRIAQVLAAQRPLDMRGAVIDKNGINFIVDCYNANPSSMKSAIASLVDVAGERKKVAVVGDMLELGRYAKRLHEELGRTLARSGVEKIVAVGEWSGAVADGVAKAGINPAGIRIAHNADEAAHIVKQFVAPGEIVLLKGSRGMHLETILERFDAKPENGSVPIDHRNKNFDLRKTFPRSVAIIGAARSGLAAAGYFRDKNVPVFVSDMCLPEKLEKTLREKGLESATREAGGHTEAILAHDLIVLSPGVRSDIPILKQARERGIPVWSEMELGFRASAATFLAVTGSTGKSTTVSLAGAAIAASGRKVVVAGNIGLPVIGEVHHLPRDAWVVAEVSSFQLETIETFRPLGSAVLNFMKNHLDRYGSEDEYYNAKKEIARNFTKENYLILNIHDEKLVAWADIMKQRTNVIFYGHMPGADESFWYDEGMGTIRYRFGGVQGTILDVNDMTIGGLHNFENACAAAALAKLSGADDASIGAGIARYGGLPHRLEYAGEVRGVRYYNDSKSTTAESMLAAVTAFKNNVHLIAGGRDKGCDFSVVTPALKKHVKDIVLIGEAADRMQAQWTGAAPILRAATLAEAIAAATARAAAGDVIVFSPGCSSFDMFANYEERGNVFKALVKTLAGERIAQ